MHLAKDARAVALGNVRLHGCCDAYGAVPGGKVEVDGGLVLGVLCVRSGGYCMKLVNSDKILGNAFKKRREQRNDAYELK